MPQTEGATPSAMQQALQCFQASADYQTLNSGSNLGATEAAAASKPANALVQSTPSLLNQQQQQLQATFQQQFLPMMSAAVATLPSALQSADVHQQFLWQQALQTLAVTAPPAFASTAASAAGAGQSANTVSAAAAATPFLASLTFPHLMQYNLQQAALQQQLQQQQQQLQPAAFAPRTTSMLPTVTTAIDNNKRSGSSIYSSSCNALEAPGQEKKQSRKKQKRSAASAFPKGPTVVSLSGSNSNSNYTTGSSSTTTTQLIDGMDNLQPPTEKSAADLEKMTAAERRRYERNLREQQRSYRISQQIKELRDVLQESNVPFRPNKYSILVSVAEYIQQLQSRAIMLDSEHQRLINTIRCTTEALDGKGSSSRGTSLTSSSDDGAEDNNTNNMATTVSTNNKFSGDMFPDAMLVQGIEYQSVFQHCPFPLGVATLDGRVLASNQEFEKLLNPNRETSSMTDKCFFIYIRNHQEIFESMANLLKQSTATIEAREGSGTDLHPLLFWRGKVVTSRNETVRPC